MTTDPSLTPCPECKMAPGHNWRCQRGTVESLRTQLAEVTRERDEAREALTALKQDRIVSVIFGHRKGAPRPFALYRREDVSGVSGTGVVAVGCEFPDGLVVLRWTSAWPTSVVFHERGIDSVKAIHGHDGRTEIVWLSDELESLAEMEQQRDAAEARLAAALKVVEAAKALATHGPAGIAGLDPAVATAWAFERDRRSADLLVALDAYQQPTPTRIESFEVGDQQFTFEVEGE